MSTAKRVSWAQVTPEGSPEATSEPLPAVSDPAANASLAVIAQASQPIFAWWMHHWMDASHPMARLQCAWMESILEAMQAEAEFLNACAISNAKVWSCLAEANYLPGAAALHNCYHEAAADIVDAHLTRLGRVTELPEDFRQRLWEEIC